MRKTLIFILFFMVTVAYADTSATKQLAQLLGDYKTYQANFTQITYFGRRGGPPEKSSGKVMLQRPGKFRWEIEKPSKQLIIANGETLWNYEVDLQQVTKQHISKREGMNPAVLLTGDVSKLGKQFTITKLSRGGEIGFS